MNCNIYNIFNVLILCLLLYYFHQSYNSKETFKSQQLYSLFDRKVKLNELDETIDLNIVNDCLPNLKRTCVESVVPNEDTEFCFKRTSDYSNPRFCSFAGVSVNKDIAKTDNTLCTLDPHLGPEETFNAKVCSTVKCPKDSKLVDNKNGGFCYNKKINEKCALDPERSAGFPLCDNRPDYVQIEDVDIVDINPIKNSLQISKHTNFTIDECKDACNRLEPQLDGLKEEDYPIGINNKTGLTTNRAKSPENDSGGCDFFTYRKKGSKKGDCILNTRMGKDKSDSQNTTMNPQIKPNDSIDTYMKIPVGYQLHDNMDIRDYDIEPPILNKTIMECANLCDSNDNCNVFTINKVNNLDPTSSISDNEVGKCYLKSKIDVVNNNLIENSNKMTFITNHKYNVEKPNKQDWGHSCKWTEEVQTSRNQMENALVTEDGENSVDIKNYMDNFNKKQSNIRKEIKSDTQKKTLKFMINPDSMITWHRVNTKCKTVELELLRTDYLQIAFIQIFGHNLSGDNTIIDLLAKDESTEPVTELSSNKYKHLITSSSELEEVPYNEILKKTNLYTEKYNVQNIIENLYEKPDLEQFYSTKYEKNPKITFTFLNNEPNKEVYISHIYIYNIIDGKQYKLLPLKITLKNTKNEVVKYAIQKSFKEPLFVSKSLPSVPDFIDNEDNKIYKSFNSVGGIDMYKEWVDLFNEDNPNYYCNIDKTVKKELNEEKKENEDGDVDGDVDDVDGDDVDGVTEVIDNTYRLTCNHYQPLTTQAIHSISLKEMNKYPLTQYMADESNNNKLDFCACVGDSTLLSRVKCLGLNEQNTEFNKEFYPEYKPTNCHTMTGEELKKIKKPVNTNTILCKDNKLYNDEVSNIVSAGFYYPTSSSFYIFKNTTFNNQKIVMYCEINAMAHNRTNTIKDYNIVNNTTFPNLPELFYEQIDACLCIRRDIIYFFSGKYYSRYNLFQKNSYSKEPRLISKYFPKLPPNFQSNLTSTVYIGNNKVYFIKNNLYVEFDFTVTKTKQNISAIQNIKELVTKDMEDKDQSKLINMSTVDTVISYYKTQHSIEVLIDLFLFSKTMFSNIQKNQNNLIITNHNRTFSRNNNNLWDDSLWRKQKRRPFELSKEILPEIIDEYPI